MTETSPRGSPRRTLGVALVYATVASLGAIAIGNGLGWPAELARSEFLALVALTAGGLGGGFWYSHIERAAPEEYTRRAGTSGAMAGLATPVVVWLVFAAIAIPTHVVGDPGVILSVGLVFAAHLAAISIPLGFCVGHLSGRITRPASRGA